MKTAVIRAIEEYKLIAIIRGVPQDKLVSLAEALYAGGIRLLEVTYSADGSTSDTEIAENIRTLAQHFEGRMYIGAGTVLTPEQVALTKEAGGLFIISPNANPLVIQATVAHGMVSIPGALTPTEVCLAKDLGADFVKLFPVTCLGADYVKAIKAPLSHVRLLAVGGIDCTNMAPYLRAGVCGFGIGSSLTDKALIRNNDWPAITALAQRFTEAAHG